VFIEELQKSLSKTIQQTENGANGFSTSGNPILDMNFKISSYRSMTDQQIVSDFYAALAHDPVTAVKFLFFARDVRGGMGERRLFRVAFTAFARISEKAAIALIPHIAEYGRWDDVVYLFGSVSGNLDKEIVRIICGQLHRDWHEKAMGRPCSLLAKWLPSENASSAATKAKATALIDAMQTSPAQYRHMLSSLRRHIDIVERKMSANQWPEISYNTVPSRANLIYKDAFLKHDKARREQYLAKVASGEEKINAGTLFPHDVLHKYSGHSRSDAAIEALWAALPDYVQGNTSTIVVADGSGSMDYNTVGDTNIKAIEVANALAIYFAERCKGQFKDTYITFSERPQLVRLVGDLFARNTIAEQHNEVANTDIAAVFRLILHTAIRSGMAQEDLPGNILIISDMEFDDCGENADQTLFAKIKSEFFSAGYQLPRLAFWNVCSRTSTVPVQENELGVSLVSGFSPSVVSLVLSNKTDPYEVLLDKLNSERYAVIERSLENV
jgi:hypothetical protein